MSVIPGADQIEAAGRWASNRHNWIRVSYVVVGMVLLTGALVSLAASTKAGQAAGEAVKTAGKVAAVA